MKIIYTIWSKPHLEKGTNFGFPTLENFINSFVLSVNAMKLNYDDIHLYIDTPGLKMLEPHLDNLPIKKIHNILDELDWLPSFFWAFPKIHVYGLQDEPFLHIDNDAFLFTKIPQEVLDEWDIICQWFENYFWDEYSQYLEAFSYWRKFNILPMELMYYQIHSTCPNAGIYGPCNEKGLKLFKYISKKGMETAKKIISNKKVLNQLLKDLKDGNFLPYYVNMINEQSSSGVYMDKNGLKTFSVLPNDNEYAIQFQHLIGGAKLDPIANENISERIKNKNWNLKEPEE